MRIAHVIDSLDCGGAEQVAASLAVCQSRQGHSVWVVCLRGLGSQPVGTQALGKAGVNIVTLEKPPGFHLHTLRKLAAFLKEQRIDVVHAHNHVVHHYGAVAARWAGAPAVLNTLHGSSSLLMAPLWTKVLFWLSCVISDRVVSVCLQVQEVFRKSFPLPGKKTCVVNNGVDLSRLPAIPPRARGKVLTFGTIGRLDPVKDHANLLEAFAILRNKHPDTQLRLLGDGILRHELQQLAATLSVADAVCFEGFDLDVARFLGSIDVYVISSRSEGLPLTLLEAMGAGLPVVTTAVGEVPRIIGAARGGWLCPPSSPEKLAEAMAKALEEPDLSTMGAANRRAAEQYYSAERMAHDYEALYGAILG